MKGGSASRGSAGCGAAVLKSARNYQLRLDGYSNKYYIIYRAYTMRIFTTAGSGKNILAMLGVIALFFTACEQVVESGGAQSKNAQVDLIDLSSYVKPPVTGETPDTTPIHNSHYTGTIAWRDANNMDFSGPFTNAADYSAVLSLSAKKGFSFSGLTDRAFIHTGTNRVFTQVINANTCNVTVIFTGAYSTYTVIFDGNGASGGGMADQTLVQDFRQNLAANGFTPPQYHFFAGWNTGVDGDGTAYPDGASVINLGNAQNTQIRLYAQWDIEINAVKNLISAQSGGTSAANPASVKIDTRLTGANWETVLSAIHEVNKFIALDLSDCSRSDGIFDPVFSTITGKAKIVALTLPSSVTKIGDAALSYSRAVFKNFTALKIVTGVNVTTIDRYAFSNSTTLESVNFPKVLDIGIYAFENCTALISVSLPELTGIGGGAFKDCTALASVNFSRAVEIGDSAFMNCAALTTISFPDARVIEANAFMNCAALTSVDCPNVTAVLFAAFWNCIRLVNIKLPNITSIFPGAFMNCTALTHVSFPKVMGFDASAFTGCTALTSVNFPEAVEIGSYAFRDCTALNSVTLGAAPPRIFEGIFGGDPTPRTITVYIPVGSEGVYDIAGYIADYPCWGNGFRGGGWDSSFNDYDDPSLVNRDISLIFQSY